LHLRRQPSGEDARVPAVETTALLYYALRSVGVSPAAIEASRLGGSIQPDIRIPISLAEN